MNRFITLLICLVLQLPVTVLAQRSYLEQVEVQNVQVFVDGQKVSLGMIINLDQLQLDSNDLLVLTPILRHQESDLIEPLPQIQIAGRKRGIILKRHNSFTVSQNLGGDIFISLERKNRTAQEVQYSTDLILEDWMYESELQLGEQIYGCADCFVDEGAKNLLTPFIRRPYEPQLQLTYIMPEVEPVKARADRHTAILNFRSAKYDLNPQYKNNGTVLAEVNNIMREITNNRDLTVTELTVTGYASPEGNFTYNKNLAGNRANSFAQYLDSRFGIAANQMKVEGYGEDWVMTRQLVENSTITDRDEILRIIDTIDNPDERDAHLKRLSGGRTYQELLHQYYPQIRRTEYTVGYEVRPFSVEEAREIIKANPKLLSLNEMYLVAQSYPSESREFREVFDIAVRLYPDEPVAIINASAADIEGGNYKAAIERLAKLGDHPTAMNNRGVAHIRLGEVEKAKDLFQRASEAGNRQATHNLDELHKMEQQR